MLADRYQLIRIVGRGGMGEVWAGRDVRLGRDVAVKRLSPHLASEPGVRERFDVEARAAAGLNHPNVVAVFDSGEHEGIPFLVMELLPGRTLADELVDGPLDPARARRVGGEVLAALAASHAAGILHRDVKPGNVLLGADDAVKVADFGIAKSTEALDLTTTGTIVGTAAYLAPERLAGQPATAQADLYAVGVLLYEALSGQKPYAADTPMGLLRAVEAQNPVPLAEARPGLDPALVAIVERAMDPDPSRRYSSAADMAAALGGQPVPAAGAVVGDPAAAATAVLSHTRVLTAPAGVAAAGRAEPPRAAAPVAVAAARARRSLGPTAVAAILLVVAMVVIVALATRGGGPPDPATTVPTTGVEVTVAPVTVTVAPTTVAPVRPTAPPNTKKPEKGDKKGRDDG
ncbi:MAG: eukaryotic-like serine/threonine-protein kinase [Actinomycetota bacterium]|jgi:serine/threonine-protein kinase|nr:eukaryotic-like serine/threonine-protein kinase [Actinomycetota bacterium]